MTLAISYKSHQTLTLTRETEIFFSFLSSSCCLRRRRGKGFRVRSSQDKGHYLEPSGMCVQCASLQCIILLLLYLYVYGVCMRTKNMCAVCGGGSLSDNEVNKQVRRKKNIYIIIMKYITKLHSRIIIIIIIIHHDGRPKYANGCFYHAHVFPNTIARNQ